MNITSVQYVNNPILGTNSTIKAVINGQELTVPTGDMENRHYAEIMRQVSAGELTIADADPLPDAE